MKSVVSIKLNSNC